MFTAFKRFIFDIRFRVQEWKTQWKEMDEVDRIEEECYHPMAGFIAYKQMQRRHEERVKQHEQERLNIK